MSHYRVSLAAISAVLAAGTMASLAARQAPAASQPSSQTKVVLLGTGTPAANPDQSGPATAIVVNDTAYLVDFGPGVVRRASAAATGRSIPALQPTRLRVAFVTHLHSDHTVGYPDLIFTPWTLGARPEAGGAPPGTFRRFSEKYHTTAEQLADLARQAKPKLLVLYHYNSLSPEELQTEMMTRYAGHFVIGRDLDIY